MTVLPASAEPVAGADEALLLSTRDGNVSGGAAGAVASGSTVQLLRNGTVIRTTTTAADGRWSTSAAPGTTASYTARLVANATDKASTSSAVTVRVAATVTISAPARSASSSSIKVTGKVSPNKSGQQVCLLRVNRDGSETLLKRGSLSWASNYSISTALKKGSYKLVGRIGATTGNTAGKSAVVSVTRT